MTQATRKKIDLSSPKKGGTHHLQVLYWTICFTTKLQKEQVQSKGGFDSFPCHNIFWKNNEKLGI